MSYNILLCSAGRRVKLIQQLQMSLNRNGKIIVTDMDRTAPSMFFADKSYKVPEISDTDYIEIILNICKNEKIKAITTLIDPEIELLAKYKYRFTELGVLPLLPSLETAELCIDKLRMYEFLIANNINTVPTYSRVTKLPVFIKPRYGSGSVGARKIEKENGLAYIANTEQYIIQEFMTGDDLAVEFYVDTISKEIVNYFAMKKIKTTLGGAIKVVSFKDDNLLDFIINLNKLFQFSGAVDVDLFYQDGKYFVTEINPRFGGGYVYAHSLGIDFLPLIINNINNKSNKIDFFDYEDQVLMMMYDEVAVIK